jgi:hypothetical protein
MRWPLACPRLPYGRLRARRERATVEAILLDFDGIMVLGMQASTSSIIEPQEARKTEHDECVESDSALPCPPEHLGVTRRIRDLDNVTRPSVPDRETARQC